MRFVVAAGRGLCLASAGAALVAVIVSGFSALSFGQSDSALVAAFFGAVVTLVGSLWACVRFFGASREVEAEGDAPVRPIWYTGPARDAVPGPSILLPAMPRPPQWGPYRGDVGPAEAPTPPQPTTPTMADTQKITISAAPTPEPSPESDASDTRPMKAIRPMTETRRIVRLPIQPPAHPAPPDSLPESPGPRDADPPVRPSKLAL
ncbi:MAG: hypothetical protein IT323_02325 [Anaerolineae bacterium]|nr:hypothetical protein [Anaerolineae bacterium]